MDIQTREFSVDDYDAAADLWKRVEGIEIAEGDAKEEVAARPRILASMRVGRDSGRNRDGKGHLK